MKAIGYSKMTSSPQRSRRGEGLHLMRSESGTEQAGNEDCRRTSGGVFVAIDPSFGMVVEKEEATVKSIKKEERCRSVNECVRRCGGVCVVFLARRKMTAKNQVLMEAVVKQATSAKCVGLIVCDTKTNVL